LPTVLTAQRDDGRFDALRAWAGIEDQVDRAAQRCRHMGRAGRADSAAAVGRRRCQRQAGLGQNRAHHRMRGTAQRHRLEAGRHRGGQRRVVPPRQNQRQWPRPERRGQPPSIVDIGQFRRRLEIGDVNDQRIEIGPPLRPKDRRHRLRAVGAGRQAIDGLGRHRDQPASAQDLGRERNAHCIRRDDRARLVVAYLVVWSHRLPL
jgi:hypothetical protein